MKKTGLLTVLSLSCSRQQIKEELKSFYAAQIQTPHNLFAIQQGSVLDKLPQETPCLTKLMIYISSTGCTPCKVSHISDMDTLFNMNFGAARFTPQIIINPSTEQFDDMLVRNGVYVPEKQLHAMTPPHLKERNVNDRSRHNTLIQSIL